MRAAHSLRQAGMTFTEVYHCTTPREANKLLWDLMAVLEEEGRPPAEDISNLVGMSF